MPSMIPPATPPGELGFDSKTLKTVTKSGLIIEIGAGLFGRVDPVTGQLALDATRVDPPEAFSLFAPGVVAAKTIGTWRNTRASGKAIGLAMEANLLTAPTAGDANNYWRLKATDGAGNIMVLPISTAAQSHYSLNDSSGVTIARPWLGTASPSGSGTTLAFGVNFAPTQDLTVTGMVAKVNLSNFNDTTNYGPKPLTASILDANGNVITSGVANTPGGTAPTDIQFAFPLAVVLKSGTFYFMVVDTFSAGAYTNIAGSAGNASSASDPGLAVMTTRTSQSAPLAYPSGNPNGGIDVELTTAAARSAIATLTWPEIVQGPPPTGVTFNNFGSQLGALGLLGSGAGAAFVGDVTLALDSVGTPAAGAAGSDLNARLLLGVA